MKNKIQDLRDYLFEQMDRLSDPDLNLENELQRAKALAEVAKVIVDSAKVEVDFLKMVGNEGSGTGFIPMDTPKTLG